MRFTVTLDEDVAAGIKGEMERARESFKQVVNRLMRQGLTVPHAPPGEQPKAKPANRRASGKRF